MQVLGKIYIQNKNLEMDLLDIQNDITREIKETGVYKLTRISK